jgi:transaldolase/glucose-6-phosphate isomerase
MDAMNNIGRLIALGQSIWLDNIQRRQLENGEIQALIARGDLRGMTSNPTIFDHAISKTTDYDAALTSLAWAGWDAEKIFWELIVEDIRTATGLFLPLYEETHGADGFVSIEVSPYLAHDTEGTVAQAQQLWARVGRPNLMVKIPATSEGIPAIRRSVAAGLNINITLIFSRLRYAQVMEAYLAGLEERLAAGHFIDHISSVASFFVSRVDSKVDALLPTDSPLRGQIAIANAKLAYDDFLHTFSGDRWEKLKSAGARLQRPLWASTSTKNPAYKDMLYVDSLIGPDTVNTVPPQTLDAARDHAVTQVTITQGVDQARDSIATLEKSGISLDQVTDQLEKEGVETFDKSVTDLLSTIDRRRKDAVSALGPLREAVAVRMSRFDAESVPSRLWSHDPTLWTDDPGGQKEVTLRMGWTDSPQKARARLPIYSKFADQVRLAGLRRILVLGMGGSSLTAEVLSDLFAPASASNAAAASEQSVCLAILDSTSPEQVAAIAADFPPAQSLYMVSSKSGGTAEVSANFDYFWDLSHGDASHFVAITDQNTSLEALARQRGFRKFFTSDEAVGGRYSALTDFGMLPAALLGIDLDRLLTRADWMQRECGRHVPAARNPGLALGAVLGEAALAGRDKLTVLADAPVAAFASWIEQIVAESSGKDGRGILPVPLEPLDAPAVYDSDRIFVYLRQTGESDGALEALRAGGHPVIVLPILSSYDVGAEFFRWEMAVSAACHVLGVNAFDQPDVQDSKDRTKAKIQQFRSTGRLPEGKWDLDVHGGPLDPADLDALLAFIREARAGDYFAINAYLPRTPGMTDFLQRMRVAIREKTRCAVASGFGPRFQHSTGQFHKGGPNTGLFIQIVSDATSDMPVPQEGLTFGTLIRAQALGDYEALVTRGRRVVRAHLSRPDDVQYLAKAF